MFDRATLNLFRAKRKSFQNSFKPCSVACLLPDRMESPKGTTMPPVVVCIAESIYFLLVFFLAWQWRLFLPGHIDPHPLELPPQTTTYIGVDTSSGLANWSLPIDEHGRAESGWVGYQYNAFAAKTAAHPCAAPESNPVSSRDLCISLAEPSRTQPDEKKLWQSISGCTPFKTGVCHGAPGERGDSRRLWEGLSIGGLC